MVLQKNESIIMKQSAKYYGIVFAIFLFSFSILYWMTALYYNAKESALVHSARQVCTESPLFNQKNIVIQNVVHKKIHHPYGMMFFSAQYDGKDVFLIAIPLHGIYGIYSGLFLYEKTAGSRFCGIMGVSNIDKKTEYYGITTTIIAAHKKKIENIMAKECNRNEKY